MEPHETIQYKGYEIGLFYDEDAETSREWDCLGKMVCWHNRYNLGDEQPKRSHEEWFRDLAMELDPTVERRIDYWENGPGFQRTLKAVERMHRLPETDIDWRDVEITEKKVQAIIDKVIAENVVILPLYLYDHSGITMNTSGFTCPWDSGQVGYIYVTYEGIKKEFGSKKVTKAMIQKATEILKGEVETYDDYLTGNVHGYMIRPEGENGMWEGGCWGYFGDSEDSGIIESAKAEVDYTIKKDQEAKEAEQIYAEQGAFNPS